MLKASVAKTALAPRYILLIGGGLILLLLLVMLVWRSGVRIGSQRFTVERVQGAALIAGLSGRDSLAPQQVMLFTFPESGKHCMWMKDMKFSLDMLWANESGQVVHLKQHATPESYPENFCTDTPAKYVIEANSGTIQKTGVRIGDKIKF